MRKRAWAAAAALAVAVSGALVTDSNAAAVPAAVSTAITTPTVSRLAGPDRVATAVKISQHAFPAAFTSGGSVYLARMDIFADAVAAGTLTDGPVLLVPTCGTVPQIVTDEVSRLGPARVVALGSTGAVCDAVLTAAARGTVTGRLAGQDRYETALQIAWERARQGAVKEVYLASGLDDRPDAVVGGQLRYGPILLTVPGRPFTDAERYFVNTQAPKRVVALGGESVVPTEQLQSITAAFDRTKGSVMGRLSGDSRYESAAAIATRQFPEDAGTVYLARGDLFADAVAGGSLRDGPVVLVGQCSLPPAARERIAAARPTKLIALGSSGAVCDAVLSEAASASTVSGGRTTLLHTDETGWAVGETPTSADFSDNGSALAWSGRIGGSEGKLPKKGVYLRHLSAGADSALLSLSPSNQSFASEGAEASVNDVASLVAFSANQGDGTGGTVYKHIWVRNTWMSETALVSRTPGGGLPTGNSFHPQISADGGTVVFSSVAPDLVAGDTNGAPDIFAADLATGTVTLVSKAMDGGPTNGVSSYAQVSADGRFVAYRTAATNVVADDTNGVTDIVITDRTTGTTRLVSETVAGTPLASGATAPSMSADGRFVTYATELEDGLYLHDTVTGTTSVASRDAAGNIVPAAAGRISSDGSRVVYAPGPLGALGHASEWYRRDLASGAVVWLTAGFAGQPTGKGAILQAVDRDASRVVFQLQFGGGFEVDFAGFPQFHMWTELTPR